ncbi:hypothetical protein ACI2KR_08005 [Pseudomonas luteola]
MSESHSVNYYLDPSKREGYLDNLKLFATFKEAFTLSDKVILAASARLLDPYQSTTELTRSRLLNLYPVHSYSHLKRVVLIAMTNIGYSEKDDKEKMSSLLSFAHLKPFEPHIDEDNQAFPISSDGEICPGMIHTEDQPGFEALYVNGKIADAYQSLFDNARKAIDDELATYSVAFNLMQASQHILQPLLAQGIVVFCPTLYLQAAVQSTLFSSDEVKTFINNQVNLIEAEIGKSIARKNKSERERTAMLRSFVSAYQRFKSLFLNDSQESPT